MTLTAWYQGSLASSGSGQPRAWGLSYGSGEEGRGWSHRWVPTGPSVLFPQAALAVWNVILRFMGDLPEPVLYARSNQQGSSVMRQIHDTLGRGHGAQAPQHRFAQASGGQQRAEEGDTCQVPTGAQSLGQLDRTERQDLEPSPQPHPLNPAPRPWRRCFQS